MKKTVRQATPKRPGQPLRFAHPFFTTQPAAARKPVPGVGTRLLDYIKGNLEPVPAPSRTPLMNLADIIGAQGSQEVQSSGSIRFHAAGDTGRGMDSPQGDVAEPYVHYPGKIIAIPGNHDGEVFAQTDPKTLNAFLANFCAPSQKVPAIAGTIYRETMNQPGVYWLLEAPFVQIVGLYSNAAENPGFISGTIPGPAQKTWLTKTLQGIATDRKGGKRKALVFATHHPPFTAGGHSPSTEMLADIDGVCQQAGVMPDLFLSGHAHSYQRYTRELNIGGKAMQIPYVVVGTGGINDQAVPQATGQKTGDHTFVKSMKGYGYLLIQIDTGTITGTMFAVDPNTKVKSVFEKFTVTLTTNRVS
jgi:hypothetical protein